MSPGILIGQSAQEYFREAVTEVLADRRLRVQEATEFYLVDLLTRFLQRERLFVEEADGTVHPEPLAQILLGALREADRRARARALRRLGDTALFVSGFFGDSLARSTMDVRYYIAMGERAYGTLAGCERAQAELFAELAERFPEFVDLFAEIADRSSAGSSRGLLRLYERFLATRSEQVAARLRARGVAFFSGPAAPPKGTIQ
ncbi:MAG TPA: hypothetical protein VFM45_06625 [Anaeromyxobacteraceae bacterium]|nr:hypothetical protein [Anaeromyxobacteraceae bacterium]